MIYAESWYRESSSSDSEEWRHLRSSDELWEYLNKERRTGYRRQEVSTYIQLYSRLLLHELARVDSKGFESDGVKSLIGEVEELLGRVGKPYWEYLDQVRHRDSWLRAVLFLYRNPDFKERLQEIFTTVFYLPTSFVFNSTTSIQQHYIHQLLVRSWMARNTYRHESHIPEDYLQEIYSFWETLRSVVAGVDPVPREEARSYPQWWPGAPVGTPDEMWE